MTFPIDLKLGPLTLNLHLVFETLGFVIGFRYFIFLRSRQKDRITDANRTWIIIGATFGAFLIGRIGCFTAGLTEETYGIKTTFFTGIDFGDGIRRHPVTLYEIAFLALLWLLLVNIEKSPFEERLSFSILYDRLPGL